MFWHNHFVTSTTFRLVGCEVAFYWWPIECGQPKRFFLFPRLVVAYQTYGHWRAFMSSFWPFCLRSLRSWATWSFEKVSKCYEKVDSVIISVYNPPLRGCGQFFFTIARRRTIFFKIARRHKIWTENYAMDISVAQYKLSSLLHFDNVCEWRFWSLAALAWLLSRWAFVL